MLKGHTLRRTLAELTDSTFDVVVIGGGISGACLAHDAALRGLSVALVEQGDFGGATSAASSKLLHGGIRYLQQIRFDKVRESSQERRVLAGIAPHLIRWVPFLVPTYSDPARGRWFLACGMRLYAWLGGATDPVPEPNAPTSGTYYSRAELGQRAPELADSADVTGAFVLYESQLHSSERMTLAFLKTAAQHGAIVANYVSVDGLLWAGSRVAGVRAHDVESGDPLEIRARVVANAAGPWLPRFNDRFAVGSLRHAVTGMAQGAHIITRQIMPTFGVALSTGRASGARLDRGGRHVFVIPWRGHSLIGTTNRPFDGDLDRVCPTEDDVQDLIDDVRSALPAVRLVRRDVRHAFAGIYPLTARRLRPGVYQGTGDYQILDHGRAGGAEGMVSALGAKYTTARRLAELATSTICRRLDRGVDRCRTAETPLVGGVIDDVAAFTRDAVGRHAALINRATVEHLVRHYGAEIDAVVGVTPGDSYGYRQLTSARESIEAEVVFAVKHEMARQLADVVFRRTGLGTLGHPGDACLRRCAAIMAPRLGWTDTARDEQIRKTHAQFPIAESHGSES